MTALLDNLREVIKLMDDYCRHERGALGCSNHKDAPHGFNRDASHSEDRYVCDCEFWEPDPAEDRDCRVEAVEFLRTYGKQLEALLKQKQGT